MHDVCDVAAIKYINTTRDRSFLLPSWRAPLLPGGCECRASLKFFSYYKVPRVRKKRIYRLNYKVPLRPTL